MLMEVIVETILFDIKLFRLNAIIVRKSSVYILNKKLCPKEFFEYLSCDHLVSCLWCQKKELFCASLVVCVHSCKYSQCSIQFCYTYLTSGLVHLYKLNESISRFMGSGGCLHFYSILPRNS